MMTEWLVHDAAPDAAAAAVNDKLTTLLLLLMRSTPGPVKYGAPVRVGLVLKRTAGTVTHFAVKWRLSVCRKIQSCMLGMLVFQFYCIY